MQIISSTVKNRGQRRLDEIGFRLLGRQLLWYHGDGTAGTRIGIGIGTDTTADAFVLVDNSVFGVRRPGRANIKT